MLYSVLVTAKVNVGKVLIIMFLSLFLLPFVAMDPERLKRKEEIEKALGFIQYVIFLLFDTFF